MGQGWGEGIGIPESEQATIFQAFFRATNVDAISGTGLGLAIVEQAVGLLDGNIQLNSQVNVGTTVVVTLPIR